MTELSNLSQAIEHQLGGLTATQEMLNEIQRKASSDDKTKVVATPIWRKPIFGAVLCTVCAAFALVLVWKPLRTSKHEIVLTPEQGLTQSYHASGTSSEEQTEAVAETPLLGQVSLQVGSDSMNGTLFDGELDGNFSMLMIQDKVYRLLSEPECVSGDAVGSFLTSVDEYNTAPSLANGSCVSNVLPVGEGIYETAEQIPGLVIAYHQDVPRLWQRCCFAGKALQNGESLTDTLCKPEQLSSIEWVGHGNVGGEEAQQLYAVLGDCRYIDAESFSGDLLLLHLKNGYTLQLFLNGDKLCGCGSWNAAAFAEALNRLIPSF